MLVDDHQIFIDGLKALLLDEPKIHIAAEALSGEQALQILNSKNIFIDIVITDISMPGMSGIELTKAIKKQFPDMKVMVLSMVKENEMVREIIMAEAEGYLLKKTNRQELLAAINSLANNGTYYSNEIAAVMVDAYKTEKRSDKNIKNLSGREIEIIRLIVQEYSSEKIAEKLFISKHTVDTHRKNILEKTGSRTLVGLIKFAMQNHLVQ